MMEAASPRTVLSLIRGAAPRYAPVAILVPIRWPSNGIQLHFLQSQLLNKINWGVELEVEFGLIERLLAKAREDFDDGVDMRLFNDDRVLQQDDFGFGQSNRKHILDTELREALLVKQGLLNLLLISFGRRGLYLEHQSELKDVDVVDIFDLEPFVATIILLPKVVGRRTMAKVSDVVIALAPLQE
jgi:hypothetical protein